MLRYFIPNGTCLARREIDATHNNVPPEAVWIDLDVPTQAEDRCVERTVGVPIPTRDEMQEIESTSRLYEEDGALFMTATLLYGAELGRLSSTPVTFILANRRLVTVRYQEPRPFRLAMTRIQTPPSNCATASAAFVDLLDAVVDRAADILEGIGAEIDSVSRSVFETGISDRRGSMDYHDAIRSLGRQGALTSRIQESLVSLNRLILFVGQHQDTAGFTKDERLLIKNISRDLKSLIEHAVAVDAKINFLLDATLGLVGLDQNAIIKIFSVMAVVFMPPTLIASIYGMNFEHMPELSWDYGYPYSLGLMVASALATYVLFRWKRWL